MVSLVECFTCSVTQQPRSYLGVKHIQSHNLLLDAFNLLTIGSELDSNSLAFMLLRTILHTDPNVTPVAALKRDNCRHLRLSQ